jgi:CRP/FNR family cyclic AMP-dependent transcriptional regulator
MRSIFSFCQGLPEKSFKPGEVLLAEGERAGLLYVLIEGEVEILKGDFHVHTIAEPGAIFGEMSVLLESPHTATVRTVVPTRMYVAEHANAFLRSHTDLAYQVAKLLAQRLHGVTTRLVDLKHQFEDHTDHFGMVDKVLEPLVYQQNEELNLGSDRDPDPMM